MKHLKSTWSSRKSTLLLGLFLVTAIIKTNAQSGFGIKGGLNYNANGDYFESATATAENPDRNVGYHVGVFGKIGDKVFLNQNWFITTTKSDYNDDTFTMKKTGCAYISWY